MKISSIHIYPVKSCRGIRLPSALVTRRGLQWDRRWMVVDREGRFVTQRELRAMATIETRLHDDHLELRTERHRPLRLPLSGGGVPVAATVWRSTVEAELVSTEADNWLTNVLGRELRLVFMPDASRRPLASHSADGDHVSFADRFPLLLTTSASLNDLNHRASSVVPMNRFRPNVVVDGTRPFEEDRWVEMTAGAVAFRVAKACARCVVTTTDQATGDRGREPLLTLTRFRRIDGRLLFGQNLIPLDVGVIEVDDPVHIAKRAERIVTI